MAARPLSAEFARGAGAVPAPAPAPAPAPSARGASSPAVAASPAPAAAAVSPPTPATAPTTADAGTSTPLPPPDILLLVIHGMGQTDNLLGRFQDRVDQLKRAAEELVRARTLGENTTLRIEALPVEWHNQLHLLESVDARMQKITIPNCFMLRNINNEIIADVLLYYTRFHGQLLVDLVSAAFNARFQEFARQWPGWRGQIAIVGHSLGGVIAYDLLANQARAGVMNPTTMVAYPKLDFEPDFLFTLGAPVSAVMVMRGQNERDYRVPCRFHNIFHPYDPVAYRFEPLAAETAHEPARVPIVIPAWNESKPLHTLLYERMILPLLPDFLSQLPGVSLGDIFSTRALQSLAGGSLLLLKNKRAIEYGSSSEAAAQEEQEEPPRKRARFNEEEREASENKASHDEEVAGNTRDIASPRAHRQEPAKLRRGRSRRARTLSRESDASKPAKNAAAEDGVVPDGAPARKRRRTEPAGSTENSGGGSASRNSNNTGDPATYMSGIFKTMVDRVRSFGMPRTGNTADVGDIDEALGKAAGVTTTAAEAEPSNAASQKVSHAETGKTAEATKAMDNPKIKTAPATTTTATSTAASPVKEASAPSAPAPAPPPPDYFSDPSRHDYLLQEHYAAAGTVQAYVHALRAHFDYWGSKDMVLHVLRCMQNCK